MASLRDRIVVQLHGPLDGLYKATYDVREARLTIRYADRTMVLDEDECDNLLRVLEYAADPVEDLAEFFADTGFGNLGWRVAQSFSTHQLKLAELVYAD